MEVYPTACADSHRRAVPISHSDEDRKCDEASTGVATLDADARRTAEVSKRREPPGRARAERRPDRRLPECRGVWLDRGELDKILVKERQLAAGMDADEDFYAEMSGRTLAR